MSDLSDLYQEVILDHNRRPRNFGPMPGANREAHGHNPLCGDRLTVYLRLDDGVISNIQFEGSGCAISKASASLMTEAIANHTVPEAIALFEKFQRAMTIETAAGAEPEDIGKLAVLAGVREFPMRVKCATLAWHTLKSALSGAERPIRTE